jgi:hypothetical protein
MWARMGYFWDMGKSLLFWVAVVVVIGVVVAGAESIGGTGVFGALLVLGVLGAIGYPLWKSDPDA